MSDYGDDDMGGDGDGLVEPGSPTAASDGGVDAADDDAADSGSDAGSVGAAGSADDSDDSDDADDDAGDAAPADDDADEADDVGAQGGHRARAEKPRTDPILRLANRHRTVHVVPPGERVTDNRLHKTEAARIIATRAQQIADTGTTFAQNGTHHDPVVLAYAELYERRCPLTLRRVVGSGAGGDVYVEEWSPREMALPDLPAPGALTAPPQATRQADFAGSAKSRRAR